MKVFISAASGDRKIAEFVRKELEQKQIDTFTIEDILKPGEMVFDAIKRSIKNSQSYLIFLSKAGETNQNVLNEMDYIILEWKNDPTKKIIPIILDKDVKIPLFLDQFGHIDFSNNEKVQKNMSLLIDSITSTNVRNLSDADLTSHIENYIKINKDNLELEKREYKNKLQQKSKKTLLYLLIYCYVLIGLFILIFSTKIFYFSTSLLTFAIGVGCGIFSYLIFQYIFENFVKKNNSGRH